MRAQDRKRPEATGAPRGGSTGARRPEDRPAQQPPTVRDAADLADLQRTVGNRATEGLLTGGGDALAAAEQAIVQRSAEQEQGRSAVYDVVGSGGGQPLDATVRDTMEDHFGTDLGAVRVHTDARSTEEVGAAAYTVGDDIVVHPKHFSPGTEAGRHLLAHETTHVVQQRQGPVSGSTAPGGIRISDPGDRFERAAEATASAVHFDHTDVQRAATPPHHNGAGTVQRIILDNGEALNDAISAISSSGNSLGRRIGSLLGVGQRAKAVKTLQEARAAARTLRTALAATQVAAGDHKAREEDTETFTEEIWKIHERIVPVLAQFGGNPKVAAAAAALQNDLLHLKAVAYDTDIEAGSTWLDSMETTDAPEIATTRLAQEVSNPKKRQTMIREDSPHIFTSELIRSRMGAQHAEVRTTLAHYDSLMRKLKKTKVAQGDQYLKGGGAKKNEYLKAVTPHINGLIEDLGPQIFGSTKLLADGTLMGMLTSVYKSILANSDDRAAARSAMMSIISVEVVLRGMVAGRASLFGPFMMGTNLSTAAFRTVRVLLQGIANGNDPDEELTADQKLAFSAGALRDCCSMRDACFNEIVDALQDNAEDSTVDEMGTETEDAFASAEEEDTFG